MERRLLQGIIESRHDRGMDPGAAAGLADRRLSGHLAADQVRAGDHHERACTACSCGCWRDFASDRNTRSARFYRIVNEVPAVLMVLIVILVKVQPFGD